MDDKILIIISETLTLIGHLTIAWAAIAVHHRFRHEHKIDSKVFQVMRREGILGYIGITLIIAGYILRLISI